MNSIKCATSSKLSTELLLGGLVEQAPQTEMSSDLGHASYG